MILSERTRWGLAALPLVLGACSSLPDPKVEHFAFPQHVFVEKVEYPHKVLGEVKSRVDYTSLDPQHEEKFLCTNYYNKAARELLKYARDKGADAVIDVRSVVFLEDGRVEAYKTPECSDDGAEGQILLQGLAVKWNPAKPGDPAPPLAEPKHDPKPKEREFKQEKSAPAPQTEWE